MSLPDLCAPDTIEPIVGWRTWVVSDTPHGLRLRSVVHDAIWPPRHELVARCQPTRCIQSAFHPRRAPLDECNCGIYAMSAPKPCKTYMQGLWGTEPMRRRPIWRAVGKVALWGRVIVCDHGWRAEKAYPQALILPARHDLPHPSDWHLSPGESIPRLRSAQEIAAELRETYGVTVVVELPRLRERIKRCLR